MNVMKTVRRTHMYAGLALVPFVVLYGITGFLFNHPDVWSQTELRYLSEDSIELDMGSATEMARETAGQVPGLELDMSVAPRFTGRTRLVTDGRSLIVDDSGSRLFVRPPRPEATVHRDVCTVRDVERGLLDQLNAAESDTVWRVRSLPRVEFRAIRDGEPVSATYDQLKNTLTVRDVEPRSIRSFLLRLHTAHVYPASWGVDFWWAIIVDIMGLTMVAWAATGLAMWWQMKKLRRGGLVALTVCAVLTAALVMGKWGS